MTKYEVRQNIKFYYFVKTKYNLPRQNMIFRLQLHILSLTYTYMSTRFPLMNSSTYTCKQQHIYKRLLLTNTLFQFSFSCSG